ncbi:MAG: hypothetical protein KatS3mg105_3324 [Gemmatales bacterium]|nr:MAG: hypothetical protein KatS3mg105_3324 [Gemmatales bacterium]
MTWHDCFALVLILFFRPAPTEQERWLTQLGDDSFQTREQATDRLIRSGVSFPRLAIAAVDPDPEIRARARRIASEKAKRILDQWEPFPCLDSAWWDAKTQCYVSTPAKHRLQPWIDRTVCSCVPPYDDYRLATRLYCESLLKSGVPPSWIERLFLLPLWQKEQTLPAHWRAGRLMPKRLQILAKSK